MEFRRMAVTIMLAVSLMSVTACSMAVQDAGMMLKTQDKTEESPKSPVANAMQVRVRDTEGNTVTLQLNNSNAAKALYKQLPLTIAMENYSTNEKIFYPPTTLDTTNTPLAEPGTTTVAYYKPWDDVVLFYGPYRANDQLFALGTVAEDNAMIAQLVPGKVMIERVERDESF